MITNADIGERGIDHPVDTQLMRWLDVANLACGGHAGSAASVEAFRELADEHDVGVSAHLSYPDPDHFGRRSMELPREDLLASLDQQHALMKDVGTVKFHGALYHDSERVPGLAQVLAEWCCHAKVHTLLAPWSSQMAEAARLVDIQILGEAFADRRYQWEAETGNLSLVPRTEDAACIDTVEEALQQCRGIALHAVVRSVNDATPHPVTAQTLCIHSDSPIALTLAESLADEDWMNHAFHV